MSPDKKHFFVKLIPPRPTFIIDMSDSEKATMQQHVAYWGQLLERGIAIAYGPVLDPKGAYGVGVLCVKSDEELQQVFAEDPSNGLNKFEFVPMRAVYKGS